MSNDIAVGRNATNPGCYSTKAEIEEIKRELEVLKKRALESKDARDAERWRLIKSHEGLGQMLKVSMFECSVDSEGWACADLILKLSQENDDE